MIAEQLKWIKWAEQNFSCKEWLETTNCTVVVKMVLCIFEDILCHQPYLGAEEAKWISNSGGVCTHYVVTQEVSILNSTYTYILWPVA